MIRLLIAAPSAVVRAGLEALAATNPEWRLVGSQADLAGAEDLHPDVVLASLPLDEVPAAGGNGPLPVVLLASEAHPVWTAETLRLGVHALLPRDATESQIVAAVEAAARGLAVIDPRDLEPLLAAGTALQETASHASALTARELEVLRMIADGAPNKIIAWKLGISDHTVKFHVASILSKLGVSSRTEAVTLGIRAGLILL